MFDQFLEALGELSKHSPKIMIDSIMVWRKAQSDNVPAMPDAA